MSAISFDDIEDLQAANDAQAGRIAELEATNNALAAQALTWEQACATATQQNAILRGKVDELTARVKELDYDWSQMVYEVGHTSEEAEKLREKNLALEEELTRLRAIEAAAQKLTAQQELAASDWRIKELEAQVRTLRAIQPGGGVIHYWRKEFQQANAAKRAARRELARLRQVEKDAARRMNLLESGAISLCEQVDDGWEVTFYVDDDANERTITRGTLGKALDEIRILYARGEEAERHASPRRRRGSDENKNTDR